MKYELLQPHDKDPWIYMRLYPEDGESPEDAGKLGEILVPGAQWHVCKSHAFTLFPHSGGFDRLTLAMYIFKLEDAGVTPHPKQKWDGATDARDL